MNRRMRNRMSGGVGGRQGRPCLLPDLGRLTCQAKLIPTEAWETPANCVVEWGS